MAHAVTAARLLPRLDLYQNGGIPPGLRTAAVVPTLFDGVARFLEACRARADVVAIVSHKTELAHHDPHMTDLRVAALRWMEGNRFFEAAGLGIGRDNVFFEGTRDEKGLRWIQAENRTQPDQVVAQTGYMQGASGMGMLLLRLDGMSRRRRLGTIFPDNPFD